MRFDEDFLVEVGLAEMPANDKQRFLDHIQEELEIRIGERVSKGLTEIQLNEFDMLIDQTQITRWLEINRPDYREIVQRTAAEIKDEIFRNRARILAPAT